MCDKYVNTAILTNTTNYAPGISRKLSQIHSSSVLSAMKTTHTTLSAHIFFAQCAERVEEMCGMQYACRSLYSYSTRSPTNTSMTHSHRWYWHRLWANCQRCMRLDWSEVSAQTFHTPAALNPNDFAEYEVFSLVELVLSGKRKFLHFEGLCPYLCWFWKIFLT